MDQASLPQYDKFGRMKFHPDYHERHKAPWTNHEEEYLIENYVKMGPERISLALGRTIGVVMTRAYELRRDGKMPKRPAKAPYTSRTKTLAKRDES